MRNIFLVGLFVALFISRLFAADSLVVDSQRDFYLKKLAPLYTQDHGSLHQWAKGNWSVLGLSYRYQDNGFKAAQGFDNVSREGFHTESMVFFPDKALSFYGKVDYNRSTNDGGKWNLSFDAERENLSPYQYTVPRTGDWETDNYELIGIVNKTFADGKWGLSFRADYVANLNFRILDPRNENYNHLMKFMPALYYQLDNGLSLTLSAGVYRNKSSHQITSKYKHDGSDSSYWVFLLTGLGSYDKSPSSQLEADELAPVFALGAKKTIGNDLFSVHYSVKDGTEAWQMPTGSITTELKYAEYDYLQHDLTLDAYHNGTQSEWVARVKAQYLDGDGSVYQEANSNLSVGMYVNNYSAKRFTLNGDVDWLRKHAQVLSRIAFSTNVHFQRKSDLIYSQIIEYTTLFPKVTLHWLLPSVAGGRVGASTSVGTRYAISSSHNTGTVAQDAYTQNVAYHDFAFATANLFDFSGDVYWETTFRKSNILRFEVGAAYQKAMDLTVDPRSLSTPDDSAFQFVTALKLYF